MGPSEQAERARVEAALERLAAGDAARHAALEAVAEASFRENPPREPSPEDERELTDEEITELVSRDREPVLLGGPTRAIRSGSADVLIGGLVVDLARGERQWVSDWRDLLMTLAPYHDCARRLKLDPVAVFDEAAAAGPPSIADHVRSFGRRTDIRPRSWAYKRVKERGGPAYYYRG